jgi:hypothetical protein
MKKLAYPWLLVAASLMFSIMLTTITAVTFASYEKEANHTGRQDKLTKIVEDKTANENLSSSR